MKKISDFNNATEKYPVIYAGSATRPEFVDMPTILQQQEGVAPMDTLPAQWWNAMWKLATRDINAFRDYVGDAFTEINNLLVKFNITLADADTEQLYDFFHDDYVQNYLSTFFVNKNGDTIDGDLHIKGDLSVDGVGEEIISTELKVGANTITLRNGNPTPLGNTELAGVVTENYDGNNHNNIIAINKNGVARVGDIDIATRILYSNDGTNFFTDESLTTPATIGATEEVRDTGNQTSGGVEIYEGITYSNDDTQAIATREENPVDGAFMKWDATRKCLVSGSASAQFDIAWPIGVTYPQYPGCKSPNELWGQYSTWVELDFGGAFFRSSGGNASSFEATKNIVSISGTSVTIYSHGLSKGCILLDPENNESRIVTSVVDANNIVIDSAFTNTSLASVLVSQNSQNLSHSHSFSGTTGNESQGHTHGFSGSTGIESAAHTHGYSGTTGEAGSHAHTVNGNGTSVNGFIFIGGAGVGSAPVDTDSAGNHSHSFSGTTGGESVNHTHSFSGTTGDISANHTHSFSGSTGASGDTESRPIDFTFKVWKRIA